jgi:hypothetical protein
LGYEVRQLWGYLRGLAPSDFDGKLNVLRMLAAEIPVARTRGQPSLQASITADLEQIRLAELSVDLSRRPATDRQRWLFFNVTRESSLVFTAFRRAFAFVPDDEWVEIAARFLGLPSPCCAAIVGSSLRVARNRSTQGQLVDRFGDSLQASTCFEGDGFRLQHDAVVSLLVRFGKYYAGTEAVHEDANVFGSVLRQCPQPRLAEAEDCRRTVVVDARIALPGPRGGRSSTLSSSTRPSTSRSVGTRAAPSGRRTLSRTALRRSLRSGAGSSRQWTVGCLALPLARLGRWSSA